MRGTVARSGPITTGAFPVAVHDFPDIRDFQALFCGAKYGLISNGAPLG
jgi:hypothetical protein